MHELLQSTSFGSCLYIETPNIARQAGPIVSGDVNIDAEFRVAKKYRTDSKLRKYHM